MGRPIRDRVYTVFRHNTAGSTSRGALEWFRRILAEDDIAVASTTLSKWLTNGLPVDRIVQVEEVIRPLEMRAVSELHAEIAELMEG